MRIPTLAFAAVCASLASAPLALAQEAAPVEVIAHIDIDPAHAKAAEAAIVAYRAAASGEAGNLTELALEERGRPSRFAIVERWKDEFSYKASRAAPARTKLQAALASIERAPVDERAQSDFLFQEGAAPRLTTVFVLTHVDVTPPKRPETEGLLKALVTATRPENGVVSFDVFRQAGQANHFTLFEAWSSPAAFNAHGRASATIAFRRAIAPLLGALYDERIYRRIR